MYPFSSRVLGQAAAALVQAGAAGDVERAGPLLDHILDCILTP